MISQLDRDLYCLRCAGYVVLHDLIPMPLVEAIDASVVEFEREIIDYGARGTKVILQHNWPLQTTRCLFAVSREVQDFAMNDYVQRIARGYLGEPVLRDCLLQTVMPDGRNAGRGAKADVSFHRDIIWPEGEIRPMYLHAFLMLTDCNEENGATLVVPGTHTAREPGYYFKHSDPRARQAGIDYVVYERRYFPSVVPIEGSRGTVVLLDPMTIHTQGNNITNQPRRLLNATFRHAQCDPSPKLLNARGIAELYARVPVRSDLLALLEDDPTLSSTYGPLGAQGS